MKNQLFATAFFLLIQVALIGQYEFLLGEHFSANQLKLANTASCIDYLNNDEKEVIQILNLARVNPKEFTAFYLDFLSHHQNEKYTSFSHGLSAFKKKDRYFYSLYKELLSLNDKELDFLYPCDLMYDYAKCWAKEMGVRSVTGHNRKKCADGNFGECCSYMNNTSGVEHVLLLLIDEDIKDLGHRDLMFTKSLISVGVSFAPHKEYGKGLVMDFTWEKPVNANHQLVKNN